MYRQKVFLLFSSNQRKYCLPFSHLAGDTLDKNIGRLFHRHEKLLSFLSTSSLPVKLIFILTFFSKNCAIFRKDTDIHLPFSAKLWLRRNIPSKKAVPYEPLHSKEQTASHTAIKSPLRMQSTSVHNRSAASITEAAVFIYSTNWNLIIFYFYL